MSSTFGDQPGDVVTSSRGDVLEGVSLSLYPTKGDAVAGTNLLTTVVTDVLGRWSYTHATLMVVWARPPEGQVWSVEDPASASSTYVALSKWVRLDSAVADDTADDTAALNADLTAAAGGILYLRPKTYRVAGALTVPANTTLTSLSGRAIIRQTGVNFKTLTVGSNVTISGISFIGRGAAGYNPVSETNEVLIHADTVTNLKVTNCTFTGIGSMGIRLLNATDVTIDGCVFVGPGTPTITALDGVCYGILVGAGSFRVRITKCDLSELCQGILQALNGQDLTIDNCKVHEIRGQHGLYISSGIGLMVTNITIANTAANGIKIQLGSTTTADSSGMVVSNIMASGVGDTALIVYNVDPALTRKFTGSSISNITAINCYRGLYLGSLRGAVVTNVTVRTTTREAITVLDCWDLNISGAVLNESGYDAVKVTSVTNGTNARIRLSNMTIRNPATGNVAANLYGIAVYDCTDLTVENVQVSATNGFMVYGLFFAAGDQTTFILRNSTFAGDTGVSVRLLAATALKEWANNQVTGTITNYPTTTPTRIGGRGPFTLYAATAIPTAGTFKVGDECANLTPVVGSPKAWLCTVAGTPGTWVSTGNL